MNLDFLFVKIETPVLAAIILLEAGVSAYMRLSIYHWKDTFINFCMTFFNMLVDLLMRGVNFGILLFFFHFAFFRISNPWIYWIALFFLEDFFYYVLHCVDHYSRLFWAVHVTHHSSEKFNLTVGFRSSVFQPLYRSFYFVPLALMGFEPLHILFMYAVTQFYGTLVHSDYVGRLGFLEYFMVTPSHHRVHHASNPEYLDKNMGMCLVIWDRIFGTFQDEMPDVKPVYGLTTRLDSYNPFWVVFHEWISMGRDIMKPLPFRHKIRYIFGLPGWSHDGSRKTSRQMKEALQQMEVEEGVGEQYMGSAS